MGDENRKRASSIWLIIGIICILIVLGLIVMNLITVNYTLSPNNISTEQPTNVTGIGIAGGGKLNFTWDGNTPSIFGVNKVNYLSKNKEAQT